MCLEGMLFLAKLKNWDLVDDILRMNLSYPLKLIAAGMRILLTFSISYLPQMLPNLMHD
jgi:hypothetical protein